MNPFPGRIRGCEPADIQAITQIYSHHVLHGLATFEIEPPGIVEMAQRRTTILGGGFPFLVAEKEGKVVGYAYAGSYRPRPAYRFTVENSVYVHADCLKQGIGRLLMSDLIGECGKRGFHQMVAVIGDSQNRGSIRLHESLGFAMIGVLPSVGFKFGRWVDSALMQRGLQGSSGT